MSTITAVNRLALLGGQKSFSLDAPDLFHWPIVTQDDEAAVVAVLRQGKMSGTDITKEFEKEWAVFNQTKYALGTCNGTAAIQAAMWACGVGAGDEIIAPSMTYWASAAPALMLGATVNFADIDRDTLCIDPNDIEQRIGPRTKAIVVVHYTGHPCEMDSIMAIARKHNVKVIEDVSHAHGSLYKGRKVGSIGDIGPMSMMGGKGFAVGEAGMIVTNNQELYERCIAFGHYERTGVASNYNPADPQITLPELKPYIGLPLGGCKQRMNQTCSAFGRSQLKRYPERLKIIQSAMNRFWDLLDGVPGLKAHRPPHGSGSTMGCWYAAAGCYRPEQLGGLACAKFAEAVRAEGVENCWPAGNRPLHVHPYFHTADIFHHGKPTAIAFGQRDVRQGAGALPVAESINQICIRIPWFKHDRVKEIKLYADAYRKVAENADQLL
ncbi:MAG: UDP-4-amino-4-deoxy-L-arabinose--oxoglutarate aminotransferase [Verrucomicrobiae bacterium]|nr:UDP-4-amino-4-deoxy-L-arabinose--oxoglutarate aminotransferase [Verrucomicrobiae bacterium]